MPWDSHSSQYEWGVDSHPPGGLLKFLRKTTPRTEQHVCNGSSSQPIDVGDDCNVGDCVRTEKCLPWTKEEDLRLVSAWLNNSNDPIQSNYKKNDQYWNGVAAVYNSTTPKNRARQVKQVKDRAVKSYEEDHKKDGPFMFKHCWDVLSKEPKWDAYLERLEDLEPDKRKFNVEEGVGHHFSLDDARDERPIGGKQAKEQQKQKRKDQAIIDLEEEFHKLVDAQNTANEGHKEMLETQRHVSSENVEARKLKEHKESTMLETYKSLMMQDTTGMPEDVRSEHMLALRCFKEKLFGKTD
ncbi:hypothetical protein OsI_04618 [Oryza sativa Indica Group]|uniref:No apical meristem-associated C-terminal domain-containing protein n=1 Tax=Oryza sativa subsp. indica TaxID=39946 RepID=B8A704_ORYSI|nr:hypothetical protein OsI_04618 [Oryza sativa Indica Group]